MTLDLVLDLETIPDPELPPYVPKEGASDFAPPPYHKVVAIGCLLLENLAPTRIGLISEGGSERDMIAGLVDFLEKREPRVVTWNGRGFDMPVVAFRALRHGVPMPKWYGSRNTRYRYSTEAHFDLDDYLSDHGASRRAKLDSAARLVGFPGKTGTDGADVQLLMASGLVAEVGTYCLTDVAQTAAVFLRVEYLRGEISLGVFRDAGESLIAFFLKESRLAQVMATVNCERYLLKEAVEP
jgi:predicted PolB exonuclease-like 3'-5' exonuclease